MDGSQFDGLVRRLAAETNRRGFLRALGSSAAVIAGLKSASNALASDGQMKCSPACKDCDVCSDGLCVPGIVPDCGECGQPVCRGKKWHCLSLDDGEQCADCGQCVEGACILTNCGDPCQHISCGVCSLCDAGSCEPVDCGDPCLECVNDACLPKACGACEMCVAGACEPVDCGDPCLSCFDGSCRPKCPDPCAPCDETGSCTALDCGDACLECVGGECRDKDCGACLACEAGACVNACDTCQECVNGSCEPVDCGDSCLECVENVCQSKSCGICETCQAGECVATDCGDDCLTCVDDRCEPICTDSCAPCDGNGNCLPITCADACQECFEGACVDKQCASGLTCCDGDCIDATTDAANCGGCAGDGGATCPQTAPICSAGNCTCPSATSCNYNGQRWCCTDIITYPDGTRKSCCCDGRMDHPETGEEMCNPCPFARWCYCNSGPGGHFCYGWPGSFSCPAGCFTT